MKFVTIIVVAYYSREYCLPTNPFGAVPTSRLPYYAGVWLCFAGGPVIARAISHGVAFAF